MAEPLQEQQSELSNFDRRRDYVPHRSKRLNDGRKASHSLDIIIVGCGLGGLAAAYCLGKAGHKIRVVEQSAAIGEVGAGIQVTPNVSRLLIRWGLGPILKEVGVEPQAAVFRRYGTGEKIGSTKWGPSIVRDYGSPFYQIHRADFHQMLLDIATPYMSLHLNKSLLSVSYPSSSTPLLTFADGTTMTCDLVIGADGVKSLLRQHVMGTTDAPRPTGDAAYRAIVPTSKLLADPSLRDFVLNPEMTAWMGPRRHVMGYCIRAREEYNMVLLHPDNGEKDKGVESWCLKGNADKMREEFSDFEPRVQKLLSFIPTTLEWKLMDRDPLPKWIDERSRVVLLGDACHPMLPYRAQGAAMAIEDAAVLGNIFSHLSAPNQITEFLQAYFNLRHRRTSDTQASSRLNQHILHLPDGPEQEKRDEDMREAMEADTLGEEWKGNPNQWADKVKSRVQFWYDADEEVDNWWRDFGRHRWAEGYNGGMVQSRL